jgi:hypothetical protein
MIFGLCTLEGQIVYAAERSYQSPLWAAQNGVTAFPGAEGGGKFATGGRSGELFVVTSLGNSQSRGSGTFREAISTRNRYTQAMADAGQIPEGKKVNDYIPRMVVFNVGGTVNIGSQVRSNIGDLTVLGQTAPGDGITLNGGNFDLTATTNNYGNVKGNIIVRYLRIRTGSKENEEPDGLGGRYVRDVIVDHCSASWSTDEIGSLYNCENTTMQWCIFSEALRMSNHFKGAHGYGAIWGGDDMSYIKNLLAHNDSRNPRLHKNLYGTEMANNVVYNWAGNSGYGADSGWYTSIDGSNSIVRPAQFNFINNYYKFGPSTNTGVRSRIFNVDKPVSGKAEHRSKIYATGNYVYNNSTITDDNWSSVSGGFDSQSNLGEKLSAPVPMKYQVTNLTEHKESENYDGMADKVIYDGIGGNADISTSLSVYDTAETAYEKVLNGAGANYPKRDSIDARVVAQVKNQTGGIVNHETEVGGFLNFPSATRQGELIDNCIPKDWAQVNNMPSGAKAMDLVGGDGSNAHYTWVEVWANSLVGDINNPQPPTNPDVKLSSPYTLKLDLGSLASPASTSNWKIMNLNEACAITADVTPKDGTSISKIEIYDRDKVIKELDGAVSINESVVFDTFGEHYISVRAYNDKGESTQSDTAIVFVNPVGATNGKVVSDWQTRDIGTPKFAGNASYNPVEKQFTVSGSGRINSTSDRFRYMYKQMTGNFEFVTHMDIMPRYTNSDRHGIMVRSSLDSNSAFGMISINMEKMGRNAQIGSRTTNGGNAAWKAMDFTDENYTVGNKSGLVSESCGDNFNYSAPYWIKVKREGNKLTFYTSMDGKNWGPTAITKEENFYSGDPRKPEEVTISSLPPTVYVGIAVDSSQGSTGLGQRENYSIAGFSAIEIPHYRISGTANRPEALGSVTLSGANGIVATGSFAETALTFDNDLPEGIYEIKTTTLNGFSLESVNGTGVSGNTLIITDRAVNDLSFNVSTDDSVILAGDCNVDKVVNAKDLLFIKQYLLGKISADANTKLAMDCNRDGRVDISDVTYMKRYLAKISGFDLGYFIVSDND